MHGLPDFAGSLVVAGADVNVFDAAETPLLMLAMTTAPEVAVLIVDTGTANLMMHDKVLSAVRGDVGDVDCGFTGGKNSANVGRGNSRCAILGKAALWRCRS